MSVAIEVDHLSKNYKVFERSEGIASAVKSLLYRSYKTVAAVQDVSFTISHGEMVAFLGPNGSGKTTTLKMLSGLLHPSGGNVEVLGYRPQRRETNFLRDISMVMGNRQQLHLDIPIADSFDLHRRLYGISGGEYRKTLKDYTESFELHGLMERPPRMLSLGQRMRCELALALLHRPKVMFLDEPTLGLDLAVQSRVRECIRESNQKYGTVVLLTSHYMADVVSLCRRILFIDAGRLVYDGPLSKLTEVLAPFKLIDVQVETTRSGELLASRVPLVVKHDSSDGIDSFTFRVHKDEAASFVGWIINQLAILDITVSDPPIEYVIDRLTAQKLEATV